MRGVKKHGNRGKKGANQKDRDFKFADADGVCRSCGDRGDKGGIPRVAGRSIDESRNMRVGGGVGYFNLQTSIGLSKNRSASNTDTAFLRSATLLAARERRNEYELCQDKRVVALQPSTRSSVMPCLHISPMMCCHDLGIVTLEMDTDGSLSAPILDLHYFWLSRFAYSSVGFRPNDMIRGRIERPD